MKLTANEFNGLEKLRGLADANPFRKPKLGMDYGAQLCELATNQRRFEERWQEICNKYGYDSTKTGYNSHTGEFMI